MKTLLEVDRETPLVRLNWRFDAGAASDERMAEGLTNLMLEALKRAGKTRTRQEIAQYLYEVSSQLSIQVTAEYAQFSALVPSTHLTEFCKRLSDVIDDASFKGQEVSKLKNELIENIDVSLEHPGHRAATLFRRLHFKDDLWGNLATGSRNSLSQLSSQDLNEKKRHLFNGHYLLALSGDVEASQLDQIKQFILRDSYQTGQTESLSEFLRCKTNRLGLWHDPLQTQATVVLGWSSPRLTTKKWIALKLAEKILCSDYSSFLCHDFRQRAGLTYGIYGAHFLSRRGSMFRLRFSTASQFGPQLLSDLIGALQSFQMMQGRYQFHDQDGQQLDRSFDLSGDVFESCKKKMVNSLPFQYHNARSRLARQIEQEYYGLEVSDREHYRSLLSEVNPLDVSEVISQMFASSGITIAIVDNMDLNSKHYKKLCGDYEIIDDGQGFCLLG